MDRPKLASPVGGQGPAGDDGEPVGGTGRFGGPAGYLRGPVGTVVVDENDGKASGVLLPQQRADAVGNAVSLVARGYNRNDVL
jgi:hypothetical protein